MIYNTRNQSDDPTEIQREKRVCFNVHAGGNGNLNIQCTVAKQIRYVY